MDRLSATAPKLACVFFAASNRFWTTFGSGVIRPLVPSESIAHQDAVLLVEDVHAAILADRELVVVD